MSAALHVPPAPAADARPPAERRTNADEELDDADRRTMARRTDRDALLDEREPDDGEPEDGEPEERRAVDDEPEVVRAGALVDDPAAASWRRAA